MKLILRNIFALVIFAALMPFVSSCVNEDMQDGAFTLYYPTIVDMGPSMTFTSEKPTYKGEAPSQFAIAGIKLDGKAVETECFSINPDNGAVTISNTANIATGTYCLSISCVSGGRTYDFPDIFVAKISPSTPENVEVSQAVYEIPYDRIGEEPMEVTVTPIGESVSIRNYSLIQEEGKEYFAVSKDGVISFNTDYSGEIIPGVYPLSVTVETYAGRNTYANLLTVRITSIPLAVTYTPAAVRMEEGTSVTSAVPVLKGLAEEVSWAIKATSPATDQITIDPATGVLSVAEGNTLAIDDVITVDLTVTNSIGSADFAEAFSVTVIDFIQPVDKTTFIYEDYELIQAGSFFRPKKEGFIGDEVTFSFGELPAAVAGQLEIDAVTGEISAQKGNTIPVGEHLIPVKATNTKGTEDTVFKLTVIENPYYFTRIEYGNNLGLTPAADYANQFHAATANEMKALDLTPATDAKPGVELEWSVEIKHQMSGTTINESTGKITPAGFKANNGGLLFVTATAGRGTSGETTVRVPVFFSFIQAVGGVNVRYKPFVIQANPRKGVRSAAPTLDGQDDASKFLMDYRRTFNYYNFEGPASHKDGQPNGDGSFLKQMWTVYYTGIGSTTVNTGSKDPLSYYSNKTRLSSALLYVDAATKELVVNPNKWIDANNVAAEGCLIGQITFVTDGNEGGINNGNQIFPVWVWFSEKF